MRLQRVQIPNFRVLKDIDITFENYHTPQIFPLASQNGGGKSTFLQLVFILLTCCYGGDTNGLVKNLIENSISIKNFTKDNNILSVITLIDNGEEVKLDFIFHTNSTLHENFLVSDKSIKLNEFREHGIGGYNDLIEALKNERDRKNKILRGLVEDEAEIQRSLNKDPFILSWQNTSRFSDRTIKKIIHSSSPEKALTILREDIDEIRAELTDISSKCQNLLDFLSKINTHLTSQNIKAIYNENNLNLICKVTTNTKKTELANLLKKVSGNVFIAAPSSQVFLFLSAVNVSSLFADTSNYYEALKEKQKVISNLFLYEFSMVKVLTDAFKKAFDSDRSQAIKSGGKYGKEFENLFNDLKDFLNGKTIQPSEDMSKIVIKQKAIDDQNPELSPADLSHGELRRLSFYAWLKTNKIKNSVVLVDEIEIGLHPDWQYQIVRDLEEWEPSNQYILATHSYEICSALSPAHVKEIEPKLLKSEAKIAQ